MTLEKDTRLFLEAEYKSACQRFGKFLDKYETSVSNPGGQSEREEKVKVEKNKYGEASILNYCAPVYVKGNYMLSSTLTELVRKGIHTKEDLLNLNTEEATKKWKSFGPKKAECANLLKDMIAAEKAIQ